MRSVWTAASLFLLAACVSTPTGAGRESFVSVSEVDSSIVVEMRYFGSHNFLGRPVAGYRAPVCLLTREAARALLAVQADLRAQRLSLKVYDCYRPQRGVNDFIVWAKEVSDTKTKREFYPLVDKRDVFKLGYVASRSGHSRGSTVDLTVVPVPLPPQGEYREGQPLVECFAPREKRFKDNSIEMGTGYDCFDLRASTAGATAGSLALKNKLMLKAAMEKRGFENYEKEWWHYTLKNEPFPQTYFDFEVE